MLLAQLLILESGRSNVDNQRAETMKNQTPSMTDTIRVFNAGLNSKPNNNEVPAVDKWILALTRNGHMSRPVMDYVVNVAQRLNYNILAVHVDTMPLANLEKRARLFAAAVRESVALLRERADRAGLMVEHVQAAGKIGALAGRLCRSGKRVEFVVIDKGIRREQILRQSPVPVFEVVENRRNLITRTLLNSSQKGDFTMSTTKKRHWMHCLLFGAFTAGLYAAVFGWQEQMMNWIGKGGAFALLPVATVLAVSYFHGNFTSSFWSALGIEASRKGTITQPAQQPTKTVPAATRQRDTRVRARLNA